MSSIIAYRFVRSICDLATPTQEYQIWHCSVPLCRPLALYTPVALACERTGLVTPSILGTSYVAVEGIAYVMGEENQQRVTASVLI